MIRFSRIFDQVTEAERRKMGEVQAIFRTAFSAVPEYADRLPEMITDRSRRDFEVVLLTAETTRDRLIGFALTHVYTDLRFAYLDYIASDPSRPARGIGDALYEALREYAVERKLKGVYMDVPPDEPGEVSSKELLAVNRRRLRFYERFGARPIVGTLYDESSPEGELDAPYLVFDPLGSDKPLSRVDGRKAVRAILHRKYGWPVDGDRTERIVRSFSSDPVQLREPRYKAPVQPAVSKGKIHPLKYLVTARHDLHHVRERGYVERPARVRSIVAALKQLPFEQRTVRHHDDKPIRAVHDGDFVNYLEAACKSLGPKETLYPYVFPIRRPERKPKDRAMRAGYYCIDTFTPLSRDAWAAARDAADCAMTGADLLLRGEHLVYSLCRPPGHHAERRVFGGFCYFNNAAIAAQMLVGTGKVAMLDIDFHHGNGAQDIFFKRRDVFTQSIHGHPNHAYPYFSGFADEVGEGDGKGFNKNYPLPEGVGDDTYLEIVDKAAKAIRGFKPTWLVISLGFDTMSGDPTGSFKLTPKGLGAIGDRLGRLELPTLIVQEGGYTLRNLRRGAMSFFEAIARAWY